MYVIVTHSKCTAQWLSKYIHVIVWSSPSNFRTFSAPQVNPINISSPWLCSGGWQAWPRKVSLRESSFPRERAGCCSQRVPSEVLGCPPAPWMAAWALVSSPEPLACHWHQHRPWLGPHPPCLWEGWVVPNYFSFREGYAKPTTSGECSGQGFLAGRCSIFWCEWGLEWTLNFFLFDFSFSFFYLSLAPSCQRLCG